MICSKCGENVDFNAKICPNCKSSLEIARYITSTSNGYYNRALMKAKISDMSGAVEDLKKSTGIDKNNIQARNLLGLIYFQTGEVVAAITEWVISKSIQPEDNRAEYFINEVQGSEAEFDNMNQAVKKYNQALSEAGNKGEDLAVIHLKKAVSLSPNYLKAYQLLALLYINQGDFSQAQKTLDKALKIDVCNTTTLRYLNELKELKELSGYDPKKSVQEEDDEKKELSHAGAFVMERPNFTSFFTFFFGILLGVLVVYRLIVPTAVQKYVAASNQTKIEAGNQISLYQIDMNKMEEENILLATRVEELTRIISETEAASIVMYDGLFEAARKYMDIVSQKMSVLVSNEIINNVYDQDSYERLHKGLDMTEAQVVEIAKLLDKIEPEELENSIAKGLYDNIYRDIQAGIIKYYINPGTEAHLNGLYKECTTYLEKGYVYYSSEDVLHMLADSYFELKNVLKADMYYKKLLEEYPDTTWKAEAEERISQ